MTDETKTAPVVQLVPKPPSEPKLTPHQFAREMTNSEESDVWRPSHQACHLIVKIQTAANYLGFVDPTRDGYAWTAARKTEGDAAFRQLFLHADETWKRCRDLEKKLDRTTQTARTLRARLNAQARKGV